MVKYKIDGKNALFLIIIISFVLRLINIYAQEARLLIETQHVWSSSLAYLPITSQQQGPYLPFGELIYFISNWIVYLFGYLVGIFNSTIAFDTRRITDLLFFLLIGRITNIVFGVTSVYLIYLAGLKLKNSSTGIMAALFLTFMYLHVQESRFMHNDMPVIFFMLLAFLFCIDILKTTKIRNYLWASLFIGLGIGIKYTAILILISYLTAHFLNTQHKGFFRKIFCKEIYLSTIFIILGFLISYPNVLFETNFLLKNVMLYFTEAVQGVTECSRPANPLVSYLMILGSHGGVTFLFMSVVGCAYYLYKHRPIDILLISFPLIFFVVTCLHGKFDQRYILPILPFMALIPAYLLSEILSYLRWRKQIKKIIMVIAIVIILAPSIIYLINADFYKPDKGLNKTVNDFVQLQVSKLELLNEDFLLKDNEPVMKKLGSHNYFGSVVFAVGRNKAGKN